MNFDQPKNTEEGTEQKKMTKREMEMDLDTDKLQLKNLINIIELVKQHYDEAEKESGSNSPITLKHKKNLEDLEKNRSESEKRIAGKESVLAGVPDDLE